MKLCETLYTSKMCKLNLSFFGLKKKLSGIKRNTLPNEESTYLVELYPSCKGKTNIALIFKKLQVMEIT